MSDSFYIQVRGKKQGPFTADRLRQMAKRGRFGRQHRVSTNGRTWKPAEEYPELFEADGGRKIRQGAVIDNQMIADPTSVAPTVASSPGWFYSHDGQQLGPVSMEVLKHSHTTGSLKADDLVWTNGMTEWKPAEKALPGLFSGEAAAAGPSTAGPSGGPDGAPIQAHAEVANLALYSIVLAMIPIVGSIAAVICGHKALSQINDSNQKMEGRNLAIAGLVLGYGVLAAGLLGGLYYMSNSAFTLGGPSKMPQMQQSGQVQPGGGQDRPGFSQPANQPVQ
jgi:hypothetical protein